MKFSDTASIYAMLQSADRSSRPMDDEEIQLAMNIWHAAIGDLPYDAVVAGVHAWFRSHKWFPFPAELREIVVRNLAGLPAPHDAWRRAQALANNRTPAAWGAESPAIVDALQDIGGARAISMSTAPHATRRDFLDAYAARCQEYVDMDGDVLLAIAAGANPEALHDGR